ncbi:MAG: hypothetical protein Q4G19_04015 [Clostridia bacterium]|nr:hypothetical protein [Clostridia bacterium]
MYKLLLVSDRSEVNEAFSKIRSWEMLGYKPPHIRDSFEGAKESLDKHHADGICIALSSGEEENALLGYLRERFPLLPIFEAGTTEDEVRRYVSELSILLNRTHMDFSNDRFTEEELLQFCRHEFFRKVMNGQVTDKKLLLRQLRLMRSRLDPTRPCVIVQLAEPADNDRIEGKWSYGPDALERMLRQLCGTELNGLRIVPTVLQDGRIFLLNCPMTGYEEQSTGDSMTAMVTAHTAESIAHVREYTGLDLHISGINVAPDLTAICDFYSNYGKK